MPIIVKQPFVIVISIDQCVEISRMVSYASCYCNSLSAVCFLMLCYSLVCSSFKVQIVWFDTGSSHTF